MSIHVVNQIMYTSFKTNPKINLLVYRPVKDSEIPTFVAT